MASVAATIALNIVSNFATDVLKWAAGESISPISEAIRSTGALFPEIDGVEDTLKQWLVHTRVTDVLNDYIAGQVGANELPLRDLVSILLEKTQFYLPEHSRATAEKIVGIFLTKLRTTYFADLQTGILHLANRGEAYASQQQAQLTAVQQQMQQLTDELKTASGLKPSLQKHFEAAAVALDRGDYPTAKALFESLLTEVEIAPQRDLDLQRRVEVNLGKIASGLGDHVGAVAYYKRAAKIDTDRVRAAVNESVADLLGLRPQDALERLNKVESADVPLSYEFWAVKVNALLGLGQFDTALNVASSIDASGKETQRFELLGYVYRNAGKLDEAESHLRNAIRLDSSRPEIKLLLAEVLFTPALDYHKQHPGRPFSTDLADKVNEAATHLESAAKTLKEQGRFTHARGAEANLAMIRGLQGRFRESIQLLEPIVVSPEATAVNWSNLGFAYLSVGESSKAAEALRHAMGNDGDINTQLMFVQALNVAGQGERALEFCSQKATEPITRENLPWHLAKANALSDSSIL